VLRRRSLTVAVLIVAILRDNAHFGKNLQPGEGFRRAVLSYLVGDADKRWKADPDGRTRNLRDIG
jgi:hypothetical protein